MHPGGHHPARGTGAFPRATSPTIRRASRAKLKTQVVTACYAHAATSGDLSFVLYDVTTLYVEAENEDGLRKVGFSKERRVDSQVVVGLLVDRAGFPLEIGCFEGNTGERAARDARP